MKYQLSNDARPQAMTLLLAAILSIALWFIPFAEILSYPFRIFVTFIHEGGHAIAALVTGNSVQSLSVAMNGSGETYTTQGGLFSQMLVSSAGYIGAMTYGALLLVLIRRSVAARLVLVGSAAVVFALTTIFGVVKPIMAGTWGSLSGLPFTLLAGVLISAGLFAVARFASARVATFLVSFLAVQCVLNALLDLKTVFFLSSPFATTVPTDALNMANATGVPAIVWSVVWISLSVLILAVTVRQYMGSRRSPSLGATPELALGAGANAFSMPALPSAAEQVRYDKSA
ncbi:MAG TPA: M50 family metallopeptidase [Pyrinomonadaceae bacterium]|nr:M50 family metallopeptidase [Pyrinomonadaceae bacterium]